MHCNNHRAATRTPLLQTNVYRSLQLIRGYIEIGADTMFADCHSIRSVVKYAHEGPLD